MSARLVAACGALLLVAGPAHSSPDVPSTCVSCHRVEEDEELSAPVVEWEESVHALHEVSCDGCHGGDPREEDGDLSMSEEAGFLENPSWRETAAFCGVCHESLAADFSAGRPGQQIAAGERTATCVSCHMRDGHRIVDATPGELAHAQTCRGCAPLAGLDAALAQLEASARLAAASGERVAAVERRGIVQAELRRRLEALQLRRAARVHALDLPGLSDFAESSRAELARIDDEASRWDAEATRRLSYGAVILGTLALLFAALLWLQRRMR